jgi:hypothetical protein
MTDNDWERQFAQEAEALAERPPLVLVIAARDAWLLFCNLQLALTHPANTGPAAVYLRLLAEDLQAQVATTPLLARLAAEGWL